MPGLGYTSFLGYVAETVWGTRVTPATKFLAMVPRGDGLFGDSPLLKSAGINEVSTHRTRKVHPGARNAGGQIEFEVPWEGAELLFKHAFGKVATTGTNPYTHVFTISPPDWLDLVGLSLEAKTDYLVNSTTGAGAWAAGLNSFWYEGSVITFVEFSLSKDGFLLCSMGVASEDEIQATSSTGTPSASPLCNFYNDGTGSGVFWNATQAVVTDFRVRLDLGLDVARRGIASRLIKKPVPGGRIAGTGAFKAEFEGVTHFDDFRAATARSLYLRLVGPTAATQDIKIEIPVAIITPRAKAVVDNEGIIYADLPFEGFWDGTNREIKMTLINAVATF